MTSRFLSPMLGTGFSLSIDGAPSHISLLLAEGEGLDAREAMLQTELAVDRPPIAPAAAPPALAEAAPSPPAQPPALSPSPVGPQLMGLQGISNQHKEAISLIQYGHKKYLKPVIIKFKEKHNINS